jgi:hypothetical protein
MKNLFFFILMPVVILSIFSISQVYAQSPSDNNLKTCVDGYMKQFNGGLAKLDPKSKKDKDPLLVHNSTFLKNLSIDACITSYTQTGMFGHLLSPEDQEKFVTASLVKLIMEEKNKKMNK